VVLLNTASVQCKHYFGHAVTTTVITALRRIIRHRYLCRCFRADRRRQARTVADGSARRSLARSERVASPGADRIAADAVQRSCRAIRPTTSTAAARRQSRKPWRRNGNGRIGDLNAGRVCARACVFLYACSLFLVRSSAPLHPSPLQFANCGRSAARRRTLQVRDATPQPGSP